MIACRNSGAWATWLALFADEYRAQSLGSTTPSNQLEMLERLDSHGFILPMTLVSMGEPVVTGKSARIDVTTREGHVHRRQQWLFERTGDLWLCTGIEDFPALLDRCHFAAVSRPGVPAGTLRDRLPSLAARMVDAPVALPAAPAIVLVDSPTAAVSSTEVRRRVGAGESIHGLVPDAVADHISKHQLYTRQGVA